MWEDFKKFALKGNVVDLAVGVVIGSAFGKIVSSLVADIIMPIIGLLIGKVDFKGLHYHGIMYGNFIQNTFDFFIIAFSIFIFIRLISKLHFKKKQEEIVEAAAVETTEDVLKDIRALLQEKK
ncbi:large conductance mechanosensitive channel protein MscL [Rummeliibacillus suwonensis]|uniref:large conductance mechanosensitive channel protein MscL n=1 Tax=Rummeliibacillus suwonensis TaxID=1306154 RepID=UPI0011B5DD9A|nr:large conductance mechanosensitive channel protein MscL [Rummeliibacillus suwonensis]